MDNPYQTPRAEQTTDAIQPPIEPAAVGVRHGTGLVAVALGLLTLGEITLIVIRDFPWAQLGEIGKSVNMVATLAFMASFFITPFLIIVAAVYGFGTPVGWGLRWCSGGLVAGLMVMGVAIFAGYRAGPTMSLAMTIAALLAMGIGFAALMGSVAGWLWQVAQVLQQRGWGTAALLALLPHLGALGVAALLAIYSGPAAPPGGPLPETIELFVFALVACLIAGSSVLSFIAIRLRFLL